MDTRSVMKGSTALYASSDASWFTIQASDGSKRAAAPCKFNAGNLYIKYRTFTEVLDTVNTHIRLAMHQLFIGEHIGVHLLAKRGYSRLSCRGEAQNAE